MHGLGASCCCLVCKDQFGPELLLRCICFQPAPVVIMDKIACCYAAVAAVLNVTISPESAHVPLAGLAITANNVSPMCIYSVGYMVSPRD